MTNLILDWRGCYRGGWKNEIVPDAFAHPAKYSRRLIARIYDHLMDESFVTRGDKIIDPFGGVALGARDAMRCELDWTGIELEPKFHALGNANIALWNARYSSLPHWGVARLLNGDSRNLAHIVHYANASISSPPYAAIATGAGGLNTKPSRDGQQGGRNPNLPSQNTDNRYGDADGQLSKLPEGSFTAAISSPPYEEARIGETSGAANVGHNTNYGASAGQLGCMVDGDFTAAISSPPFEKTNLSKDTAFMRAVERDKRNGSRLQPGLGTYGDTDGNIGNESGETFWLASRQIVAQIHSVLAPRGVAVWVVKDFVRNRQRVPFCDKWKQLCEHLGFEHLYTARAWLVEENGTQLAYDGNHKNLRKERKSFFRRLNEKNGGPRIDWEEIIFMVKA